MLSGITVLNKIADMTFPNWAWIAFVIIMVVALIVGIIWSIIEKDSAYLILTSVIGLVIGIFTFGIGDMFFDVPTGEYTYQVTIDDSVNLKEFDSKYNIIKQEGEIYTIKEK